jgi:hypothetical protein
MQCYKQASLYARGWQSIHYCRHSTCKHTLRAHAHVTVPAHHTSQALSHVSRRNTVCQSACSPAVWCIDTHKWIRGPRRTALALAHHPATLHLGVLRVKCWKWHSRFVLASMWPSAGGDCYIEYSLEAAGSEAVHGGFRNGWHSGQSINHGCITGRASPDSGHPDALAVRQTAVCIREAIDATHRVGISLLASNRAGEVIVIFSVVLSCACSTCIDQSWFTPSRH